MEHPRRAAALVTALTGALAASVCLLVAGAHGAPAPRPVAATVADGSVASPALGPSAAFVVPFYVPAPRTAPAPAVPGPEDGAGVLGPDNLVVPTPTAPAPAPAVPRFVPVAALS